MIGVFTAGPFASNAVAGTYSVKVNQITLSGAAYTPTGTTSFVQTVTDPACVAAVITNSIVAAATLNVFDALASYAAFPIFTYTSSIGSLACGIITYSATETPPAGVSSLLTFTLQSGTLNF